MSQRITLYHLSFLENWRRSTAFWLSRNLDLPLLPNCVLRCLARRLIGPSPKPGWLARKKICVSAGIVRSLARKRCQRARGLSSSPASNRNIFNDGCWNRCKLVRYCDASWCVHSMIFCVSLYLILEQPKASMAAPQARLQTCSENESRRKVT